MSDLSEFVTLSDTTLITDSRRVAKRFGKRHGDVLRVFDNLDCGPEFTERNFALSQYADSTGRRLREVQMTKDGFVLLVMGFTGPEATKTKIAYIEAFNAMADQLQQIGMSLWEQRLELEKRDATTFMWASFGSKRMLERRRELPGIKDERKRLEEEMAPPLFQIGVH